MNDEFVIYDADQAKVEYIVHYRSSNFTLQTIPTQLPTDKNFKKVTFHAADLRAFKSDPVFIKAWQADSHFYKMQAQQSGLRRKVKSVDVILNPTLGAAFEKKKNEFKKKGGFQLLDLIITELKSHMTCYNPMQCLSFVEITEFRLESKSCKGFVLTNKIFTNAMRDRAFLSGHVTFKLRYNQI